MLQLQKSLLKLQYSLENGNALTEEDAQQLRQSLKDIRQKPISVRNSELFQEEVQALKQRVMELETQVQTSRDNLRTQKQVNGALVEQKQQLNQAIQFLVSKFMKKTENGAAFEHEEWYELVKEAVEKQRKQHRAVSEEIGRERKQVEGEIRAKHDLLTGLRAKVKEAQNVNAALRAAAQNSNASQIGCAAGALEQARQADFQQQDELRKARITLEQTHSQRALAETLLNNSKKKYNEMASVLRSQHAKEMEALSEHKKSILQTLQAMGDDPRTLEEKEIDEIKAEIAQWRVKLQALLGKLQKEKELQTQLIKKRRETFQTVERLRENTIPSRTQRLMNLSIHQKCQIQTIQSSTRERREGTVPFVVQSPVRRPASEHAIGFNGDEALRRLSATQVQPRGLTNSSAYQVSKSQRTRREQADEFQSRLALVSKIEERERLCSVGYQSIYVKKELYKQGK